MKKSLVTMMIVSVLAGGFILSTAIARTNISLPNSDEIITPPPAFVTMPVAAEEIISPPPHSIPA